MNSEFYSEVILLGLRDPLKPGFQIFYDKRRKTFAGNRMVTYSVGHLTETIKVKAESLNLQLLF